MPLPEYPKNVTISRELLEAMALVMKANGVEKGHPHLRIIDELTHPPRGVPPMVMNGETAVWGGSVGQYEEEDYSGYILASLQYDEDRNYLLEITIDNGVYTPWGKDGSLTVTINGHKVDIQPTEDDSL
jgi:hypothetical protein